jgi:hypothetical protein
MSEPWINGIIKEWCNDIPNGELNQLIIHKEKTITVTTGRFAHDSGSKTVTWNEFLAGEMNQLVTTKMGSEVLNDALLFFKQQGI